MKRVELAADCGKRLFFHVASMSNFAKLGEFPKVAKLRAPFGGGLLIGDF